jgi:hypothetical protein
MKGMISRSISFTDRLISCWFKCYWRVDSYADVTPFLCNTSSVSNISELETNWNLQMPDKNRPEGRDGLLWCPMLHSMKRFPNNFGYLPELVDCNSILPSLPLRNQDIAGSLLGWRLAPLTEMFRYFPQLLQADSQHHKIDHNYFPPFASHSQPPCHPSIYGLWSRVSVVKN